MNSDSVLSKLAREGKLKRQKADLDYLNTYLEKENPQLKLFREV
jgi:hypothetical protein